MNLIELVRTLQFMGWENPYRAITYSILRDRHDRTYMRTEKAASAVWQPPGDIISAASTINGAKFDFQHAQLEIVFLAEDVIRVSWRPGDPPVPYAIQEKYWTGASTALSKNESGWTLAGNEVSAHITRSGAISWKYGDLLTRNADEPLHRKGCWKHRAPLPATYAIYGLGGRTHGLNLRGGSFQLWNRDPGGSYGYGDDPLYLNIPTMVILQGATCYLVFYENAYPGEVSIGEALDIQFHGGMLRYYLCFGNLETTLERYSDLTGKPLMPPRWSLGFHQSRWGYRSEEDIKRVLKGFDDHAIPLSAIHLDIDYMDGFRVFTTDPHRFPNLLDLADQAEKRGVKLVTILDPGVKIDRGYRLYRDGLQEDVFCKLANGRPVRAPVWPGWVHYPDFTNPSARRWWHDQYPRLLKHGVSGIWHDMNEPAAFTAWGDPSLPLSTEHALEGKSGHHNQAHNLFGMLMNRAGLEALTEFQPDKRPFILSRSGWAGNQRYAWNWTADVESTWDGLRVSLVLMLGMGLSGIVFTGSDIGGFSGDPSPELMVRWMQLATFTPFFRTHSAVTTAPREPWQFDQPHRDAIQKMINLRYRLLPYLYTLAWQSSNSGLPLIRPFFWENPSDPAYWDTDDTFFLGSDLLIAPVLAEGATSRELSLPAGKWYSFWDDTVFEGPDVITVDTPLDQIPVFVRGGCVLPLEGEGMELHIYPGTSKEKVSLLYSDGGDGYGSHRLDQFYLIQKTDQIEIEWQSEGEYPYPYSTSDVYLHGMETGAIIVDGKSSKSYTKPFKTTGFEHMVINI